MSWDCLFTDDASFVSAVHPFNTSPKPLLEIYE